MLAHLAVAAIVVCAPAPAAVHHSAHIDHLRHIARHAPWCPEDFTPGGRRVCLTPDGGDNVITYRVAGTLEHLYPSGTLIREVEPPCEYEDGSGQRLCRWNASTSGNGVGESFTMRWTGPGPDDRSYIYNDGRVECTAEGELIPCS